MRAEEGQILWVEVIPEESKSVIVRGNWQYAIIVLPPHAVNFCVKVWYIPLRAGNMLLRVCQSGKSYFRASVWIRNVPSTHTRFDVNWDGEVDRKDVATVEYYLQHPNQQDIGYYRCDIQHNNQVDVGDLTLVREACVALAPAKRSANLTTWGRIRQ